MATMPAGFGLLPSASLQPYGSEILKAGIGQLGTPIDVGAMLPKVAGQTAFQQKGAQRLSDMYGMGDIQRDATGQVTGFTGGTGIASYQPYLDQISDQQLLDPSQGYKDFMSPYQKEIIDTTMQEYDVQAGKGRQQIADQAYNVGAFGGGRHGIQAAEYQTGSDRNRAALLAGLYGQGYGQALTQQQQQLANLQGQATYETGLEQQGIGALQALGTQNQATRTTKIKSVGSGCATRLPITNAKSSRCSKYLRRYCRSHAWITFAIIPTNATSDRNRWRFISSLHVGNGTT